MRSWGQKRIEPQAWLQDAAWQKIQAATGAVYIGSFLGRKDKVWL